MSGLTRKNSWSHWMRLKVLALALVSAAVFAGAASAQPTEIPYLSHGTGVSAGDFAGEASAQPTEIPYLSHGIGVSAGDFAGEASAQPTETPYLSLGIGVSPVDNAVAGTSEVGPQFKLNTSGTDPYLQDWRQVQSEQSSGAYQTSSSAEQSGGVTPTNLARAYAPRHEGVATAVDGRSFDLGDGTLGFGLGLLLATGCAVAIVLSRRGMRLGTT